MECLALKKYNHIIRELEDKITLEKAINIFDSKRIPLSSRERASRQGNYPYYGATCVLDYVNDYLFSGEYILLAEDGTVIDNEGHPIVQLVDGNFWVNNHAHILQAKGGYTNYSLYIALKNLQVTKAVTGAVQLKINQANLCGLELPNISHECLQILNDELDPIFKKILQIRVENSKLSELKQLYLKKFFD